MSAVELIAEHIVNRLSSQRPLFVAVQGPQGSGKSYSTSQAQKILQSPPHSLRVVVFSLDDLYLPHKDLVSLAASHPQNVLWQGRGQPGTHDVELGVQILRSLKQGNGTVELPRFDKSLYSGEGDRLPLDGSGTVVEQPPIVDVIIFEGWCVGFRSISRDDLLSRWNGIWRTERGKLNLEENQMGRLEDIEAVNEKLKDYDRLWNFFDCFIQLKSQPPASELLSQYAIVYKWRLEQEHYMKATNGGKGMSDAAVKSFVDRYIPGYIFFGDLSSSSSVDLATWNKKGLVLTLDESRTVVGTAAF